MSRRDVEAVAAALLVALDGLDAKLARKWSLLVLLGGLRRRRQ